MAETKKGKRELSCSDFRSDCDFTVRADNDEEILDRCRVHACSSHGKCDDSPEMRERIRSRIRSLV